MAAADATYYPTYGQKWRVGGSIVNTTTGNPVTGGLGAMTIQVSVDGAAFATNGAIVSEIGTTGYFTADLTVANMTGNSIIVKVTGTNGTPREWSLAINPVVKTEMAGHWMDQSTVRLEQGLVQASAIFSNKHSLNFSTETVFGRDNTTVLFTGSVTGLSTTGTATRNKMV